MAFNSGKCISCTEPTKRNAGEYRGKDEKGNYRGPMYVCDNTNCDINYERRKLYKQGQTLEEKKPQEEDFPIQKRNNHDKKRIKQNAEKGGTV